MTEITHKHNGKYYKQTVSPEQLISILREQEESLSRPRYFIPGDEWRTGKECCPYCRQVDNSSEHEDGCPKE